ncbi:MAG: M24 family metallopeptidase, partial [Methanoregula sp.]|nr:M24 family metallopeptidase [Methanoregula sp.]
MDDELMEKYREAGRIAAKVLREGAQAIRVGASYLDVVESIETRVGEEGAGLAFPLNLSLNEDAAHDTASDGDERLFVQGDVAKLDL